MAEETKVRLRLDANPAKREMSGLVREGFRTAGKINAGIRGTIGRGLGAVGLGAGVGTGLQAIRGATESGFGAVVGETFGALGAQLEDFLLGDLGADARAAKTTRDDVIRTFAYQAATMNNGEGGVPQEAKNYQQSLYSLNRQFEKGRKIIESDKDMFGPGIGDVLVRIGKVIGQELTKAVDYLIDQIPIIGGGGSDGN